MRPEHYGDVKATPVPAWGPDRQHRLAEDAALRAEGRHEPPQAPEPPKPADPKHSTSESMAAEESVPNAERFENAWNVDGQRFRKLDISEDLHAKLGTDVQAIRATQAGISMVRHSGPTFGKAEFQQKLPRPAVDPKRFTVEVHGGPHGVRLGGNDLNPRELAEVIKAAPGYKPGEPVRLLACRTGADTGDGTPNFAQELSKELGVEVVAPKTDAWVDNFGNIYASNDRASFAPDASGAPQPRFDEPGRWTAFRPDGTTAVHNSPYPPGHEPEWVRFGHQAEAAERRGMWPESDPHGGQLGGRAGQYHQQPVSPHPQWQRGPSQGQHPSQTGQAPQGRPPQGAFHPQGQHPRQGRAWQGQPAPGARNFLPPEQPRAVRQPDPRPGGSEQRPLPGAGAPSGQQQHNRQPNQEIPQHPQRSAPMPQGQSDSGPPGLPPRPVGTGGLSPGGLPRPPSAAPDAVRNGPPQTARPQPNRAPQGTGAQPPQGRPNPGAQNFQAPQPTRPVPGQPGSVQPPRPGPNDHRDLAWPQHGSGPGETPRPDRPAGQAPPGVTEQKGTYQPAGPPRGFDEPTSPNLSLNQQPRGRTGNVEQGTVGQARTEASRPTPQPQSLDPQFQAEPDPAHPSPDPAHPTRHQADRGPDPVSAPRDQAVEEQPSHSPGSAEVREAAHSDAGLFSDEPPSGRAAPPVHDQGHGAESSGDGPIPHASGADEPGPDAVDPKPDHGELSGTAKFAADAGVTPDPEPDRADIAAEHGVDPPGGASSGFSESADPRGSPDFIASREDQLRFLDLAKADSSFQLSSPEELRSLRSELSPRLNGLSDAEIDAIRTYTGDGGSYYELNKALREGDAGALGRYDPYYRTLHSALNKIRTANIEAGYGVNPGMTLVRKMSLDAKSLEMFKDAHRPGETVEFRGLTSAGLAHSPWSAKPGMNVTMVIQGNSFVDVTAISRYPFEGEFIGIDGVKLKVSEVDHSDPEDLKIVLVEDASPVSDPLTRDSVPEHSRFDSLLNPTRSDDG